MQEFRKLRLDLSKIQDLKALQTKERGNWHPLKSIDCCYIYVCEAVNYYWDKNVGQPGI